MTVQTEDFDETVAFRDVIAAIPQLAGRVGVGKAPTMADGTVIPADKPYAVIYGSRTDETSDRFAAAGWRRRPTWIVHAVGSSELSAVAALGWIDDKLRPGPYRRGITIPVRGRTTSPVQRIERPGNAEDDAVKPSVWSAIAVYGFESDPA
ncbi:hypothetical protein [Curtobacterium sp. MCBD17_030]|uniref:hypothetical protein n=1 Tax=Curtobacterium sp. MCBD17_030 TaxID=2175649 RepID=UPI000D83366F|nr:hypothetical protein [Curtobacterium sp. MCBD17_030]PYY32356.1 hypothetical protein DEI89_13050 [Curtobacterium sp. MCBD17_030]